MCTVKKEPHGTCPSGTRECARVEPGINYGCRNGQCAPRLDVGTECDNDDICKWNYINKNPAYADKAATDYNKQSTFCVGAHLPKAVIASFTTRRRRGSAYQTPGDVASGNKGKCSYYGKLGAPCYRDKECHWNEPSSQEDPNKSGNQQQTNCFGAYKGTNNPGSIGQSASGTAGTCEYLRKIGESCERNQECDCAQISITTALCASSNP